MTSDDHHMTSGGHHITSGGHHITLGGHHMTTGGHHMASGGHHMLTSNSKYETDASCLALLSPHNVDTSAVSDCVQWLVLAAYPDECTRT